MKLGIFSTHPIQYQAPLWRHLSSIACLDARVYYFSDQGIAPTIDPEFCQVVTWDVPLLDGYSSEFISKRPIEDANDFYIPAATEFLANQQLDVVLLHGYTNRFARQIVNNKRVCGYKLILRGEFSEMRRRTVDWKRPFRTLYLKWFYSHVDHFCPVGMDAVDHLKKHGVADHRMTLSPYSVDDQLFEKESCDLNKQDCRRNLGIELGDHVFIFSGKMIPRKQPLLLANAILKVADQHPQVVAIFLGAGPQYEEVKQVLEPRLGQKFVAPGFVNQSDLGKYFKSADVFVLPSNFDTWGLVVNEAMHFGLPCIVSDMVGSRRDLIKTGETGLIFRHDSSEELASCMRYFLERDGASRIMGENAHRCIQNYTVSTTAKGIEAAIGEVV